MQQFMDKIYQTKERLVKTIILNRKVQERDIQHVVHIFIGETFWLSSLKVSSRVLRVVVFPSSYYQREWLRFFRCFFFSALGLLCDCLV